MTALPTDDIASAERRIQELTKELSWASGELSQARGELVEAREQQAATAEILRVISGSPRDRQRVFADIAASAARLCDAYDVTIRQVDGDILRLVAHHGPIPPTAHGAPLKRGFVTAHAILDRRTIQVTDLQAEIDAYPESSEVARRLGHRTLLAAPLIHAGEAIGSIAIRRNEVRPFTDRQIELLKTFADQAVIAIENTRLFEAEQASKLELQESLEYQTAISDVLGVISRSPTDVQPVFDSIAQSAMRLCEGEFAFVLRFDGELLRFAASYGLTPQGLTALRNSLPRSAGNDTANGRAILQRAVVQIPDVQADAAYGALGVAEEATYRSLVAVPLLHDGDPTGGITVGRAHVGSFSDSQITLLKSFADQAVIAIENTRLFEAEQTRNRELRDSLDRQTATSEVLGVISRSPNEVQPVLDTIVATAQRLCQA